MTFHWILGNFCPNFIRINQGVVEKKEDHSGNSVNID